MMNNIYMTLNFDISSKISLKSGKTHLSNTFFRPSLNMTLYPFSEFSSVIMK